MELNDNQKKLLGALYGTPQWEALKALMHNEMETAEEAHLTLYGDPVKFERSGLIAVATKLFANSLEAQVEMFSQQVVEQKELEKIQKHIKNFDKLRGFREIAEII